jgi:hypothetical protein
MLKNMYNFFFTAFLSVWCQVQWSKAFLPHIYPASTLFRHHCRRSAGTAHMLEWWMCRIWVSDNVVQEHKWTNLLVSLTFSHRTPALHRILFGKCWCKGTWRGNVNSAMYLSSTFQKLYVCHNSGFCFRKLDFCLCNNCSKDFMVVNSIKGKGGI